LGVRVREALGGGYEALSLPGFEPFSKKMSRYLKTIDNYQKNAHELDDRSREKVARLWRPVFDRYGYPV
jgi:hypothetical protein